MLSIARPGVVNVVWPLSPLSVTARNAPVADVLALGPRRRKVRNRIMTEIDLRDAEAYLMRHAPWVSDWSCDGPITQGDLFQTTELMFLAHLCTTDDTSRTLKQHDLGRIHHRLLYVAVKNPGRSVGEVLSFLRVSLQNINRPLADLIERGLIEKRISTSDRRKRELHATKQGEKLFEDLLQLQYKRFKPAYEIVGKSAVRDFWRVLWCILDEDDRRWLLRAQDA